VNYVYIVECNDGTLYTGWTTDLKQRIIVHNSGHGAKYTRTRFPVKLRYYEEFASKGEALKREHAIKKLSRWEKLKLVTNCGLK
jgi:putative endonuclease